MRSRLLRLRVSSRILLDFSTWRNHSALIPTCSPPAPNLLSAEGYVQPYRGISCPIVRPLANEHILSRGSNAFVVHAVPSLVSAALHAGSGTRAGARAAHAC